MDQLWYLGRKDAIGIRKNFEAWSITYMLRGVDARDKQTQGPLGTHGMSRACHAFRHCSTLICEDTVSVRSRNSHPCF